MTRITIFLFFVLFTLPSFAQKNFTGDWELSKSKSKLNAEFSFSPSKIIIDQTDTNIIIEKQSEFQGNIINTKSKYTLDGVECINEGWQDVKIKSTAVWSENKESLNISSTFSMMDGSEMKFIETYQFNDKNLNIKTKTTSSYGAIEELWSYEKK